MKLIILFTILQLLAKTTICYSAVPSTQPCTSYKLVQKFCSYRVRAYATYLHVFTGSHVVLSIVRDAIQQAKLSVIDVELKLVQNVGIFHFIQRRSLPAYGTKTYKNLLVWTWSFNQIQWS